MSDHPVRTRLQRPASVATAGAAASLLATTLAVGAAAPPAAAAAQPAPPDRVTASAPGNVVVEWNRTLLSLVQTPGAQPATVQPTRDFAIMSAAVYDAVAAVANRPQYRLHLHARPGASEHSAAAQAAHDVLVQLFPSARPALDEQLTADLFEIRSTTAQERGVEVGQEAAAGLLRLRASDGADATPPAYQTTGAPGDYRPSPPAFPAPVFTHWASVQPFVLRTGDQFRPVAPPPLTSRSYADALREVKRLGQDTSTSRTPEQTTIATFWSAPIQNYWNAIAGDVSSARHESLLASATTMALLNLGVADATIALYDTKYAYRVWRPVTAIRSADADGNPMTVADPTWTPLATTPADPSYPGAHSTISEAAAMILGARFGSQARLVVTSPALPGVTRRFASFQSVAREAGLSRIYAGVHTRLDHRAGVTLGADVGWFTLYHALKPSVS